MSDPPAAAAPAASSPARAETGRLGMWVFLASDALTFVMLLIAYAVLRLRAEHWPSAAARLDLPLSVVMTFVLLASSATMAMAAESARAGRRRSTLRWLGVTIALGVAFLGGQAWEWSALRRHGVGVALDQAASSFYVTTGWHGAHVAAGVIYLTIVGLRRRLDSVGPAALFWQLLDAAWIGIFTAHYLV
jgi:heme/copper-type cytochrome/quinol oxidase subunit 3